MNKIHKNQYMHRTVRNYSICTTFHINMYTLYLQKNLIIDFYDDN